MAPLAPNALVVVTGITGYIASHTGLAALKAGYRVRGTVRSLSKAEELRKAYEKEGADVSAEKLEFVVLDDLMNADKFETVFAGVDGVIHLALPDPTDGDYVQNTIASVLVPLKAANKVGIKNFVLTGTSFAVVTPGNAPTALITNKDWNETSRQQYESAKEENKQGMLSHFVLYAVGKQLAEKAAWTYVEQEKPSFDLTVILPDVNWGPLLYGKEALTPSWITNLLRGDGSGLFLPALTEWYIDVRDCAKLHVLSLAGGALTGQRVWAAAGPFGWNQVLAILRKNFPAVADKIPGDVAASPLEPCPWKIDNAPATKALGGWIGLEKSVVETARSVGF
ncbi:NAD(P)-binding protein [Calocera cornea HHB12733]|uniref:NAD(P)-binding protein n=1 Tax=Calocera cornea HHB12733 TaxID=1353952 RepID=A0A165GYX1_9BASI|nr:NAD(P)-binding protein [Calocera cornea HHB12733]